MNTVNNTMLATANQTPRFSAGVLLRISSGFSSPVYSPNRGTTSFSVTHVPSTAMMNVLTNMK